jgi:hypothetical protein
MRAIDRVGAVAALVLTIGVALLFAGALETGVTLDEPLHVDRATSWIDDGWYVPQSLLIDGRPDQGNDLASPYVYGPAFAALGHAANVLAGNEAIDEISSSAGAYRVRHLTSALLALLAIAAVGVAVSALTGSRHLAVWAAAALVAVPEWTGQAFFNPKDTPAAAGYTLLTVGLILAFTEKAGGEAGRRRRWAIGALVAAGFAIGAGTRLSLILPFGASVAVYAGLRVGQARLGNLQRDRETDLAVAAGAGAGLATIAVLYPKAARSPVTMLVDTVSGSADYPWQGVTLTAGQLLSEHPPWWYLPAWIGASVPLLIAALGLLGAVLGSRPLVSAGGGGWRGRRWAGPGLGLLLALQQALLLPLAAVLGGAVMYSGMRQHIYALPAIAILAGVGAHRLWQLAEAHRPGRHWRAVAGAVLALALLVPTIEQLRLFPYNYAYVNPVARIGGVNDRWETDYWVASGPEALSRVPAEAELRCYLVFPTVPCEPDQLEPFEHERGSAVAPEWRHDTATWAIVRRHAGNLPPPGCEDVGSVTRGLGTEDVVMSYVLRCEQ